MTPSVIPLLKFMTASFFTVVTIMANITCNGSSKQMHHNTQCQIKIIIVIDITYCHSSSVWTSHLEEVPSYL